MWWAFLSVWGLCPFSDFDDFEDFVRFDLCVEVWVVCRVECCFFVRFLRDFERELELEDDDELEEEEDDDEEELEEEDVDEDESEREREGDRLGDLRRRRCGLSERWRWRDGECRGEYGGE